MSYRRTATADKQLGIYSGVALFRVTLYDYERRRTFLCIVQLYNHLRTVT